MKLSRIFSMLAVAGGLVAAVPVCSAENFLKNPGFESGKEHWTFAAADRGMSSVSEEAAFSGKYGLMVRDTLTNSGSSVRSGLIPARPGETWQVDFYGRMISGEGIAVYLQFFDAQKKVIRPAAGEREILRTMEPATRHWTLFHLAATAPQGTAYVTVWVHSFDGSQVVAQFDDFVLRQVSEGSAKLFPTSAGGGYKTNRLPAFPKENPEAFLAEVKLLQPDGSAYRVPIEDWEGARQRIATDPQWQQWLDKQQSELDAWIARNKDRAGWEAGWNHEFISPTDGAWLVWTQDIPGEEVDFIKSRTGEKVEITPKIFRAWVGAFRKNHTQKMGDVARLYRLTGDERYAEWVAQQLDFYADNYNSWGNGVAQRKGSWLGYQSLDDAVVVSRMLEAARLVHDWAGPERRHNWYENLFKPEARLLDTTFQHIHNISLWQRVTQAQIGLLYGDEEIYDHAMNGQFGVIAQFRHGITSDYFWYEQSMGYNDFIVMAVAPLFTFAGLVGEGDRIRNEAAMVQNIMLAPQMIRFEDNRVPNPADNGGIPRVPSGWLERGYRILPTQLGISRAMGQYSWETLVDPPQALLAPGQAVAEVMPEVVSLNMESTRFAQLKKGPWQLFFHYGQVDNSHSQAEALNWSASYNGTLISYDPGTVGYSSPLHWDWYRRGAAHNVPLIEGEGQARWDPGKLLRFDAEAGIVSAEQPFYWPTGWKGKPWRWDYAPQALQDGTGVSTARTMQIDGDRLIEETTVRVLTGDPLTLGIALHLLGTPQLDTAFKPVSQADFVKGYGNPFKQWRDVRAAEFTDRAQVRVTFANKLVMDVVFETPGRFTLYQGKTPYTAGSTRDSFYLEKTDKSAGTEFRTTFIPVTAN